MTSSKIFLLTLVFSSYIKAAASQEDVCVPCQGDIDPNLSFDGVPCSTWLSVAGSAPASSAQCAFDRMVGIWFCGCPVPETVEKTCTLCPDAADAFNANKTFPDSSITCQDIAEIPAIDGDQTCNELLQMGSYCDCATPIERCEICPNGGEPQNLERQFLTTGETCAYVMDVLDISPKNNCDMYLPDLMVDVPSFCGCPNTEPPKNCNLCPDGTHMTDGSKPIIYVPGSTCSDFDAYTAYITDDELCDYMHQVISTECCEGLPADPATTEEAPQDTAATCSFCPDGDAVAFPDRELVGLNMTCGDLASRSDDEKDCVDLYTTEFDMMIDTGVYCGCPTTEPTGNCDFCPPGTSLLYPEKEILDGVKVTGATCAEYAALADSTFDDTFCNAMKQVGDMNQCCGATTPGQETDVTISKSEEVLQDKNETAGGNETAAGLCHLCEGGASITDGDKTFLGTAVTCQTYHEEMSNIVNQTECDAVFGDFADTFNPQVYCGCPEAEPTGTCSICPAGSQVVDPTIYITDIFTTCGQLEDVAASTTNDEFCSSLQKVGEYYCCWSKATGKRNLRSSVEAKLEDSEHHQRQYHISALSASQGVMSTVAEVVDVERQSPVHHDAGVYP